MITEVPLWQDLFRFAPKMNFSALLSTEFLALPENDPDAKDWDVFHSLGLTRKEDGLFGEFDFVVIIPGEGIVCLEVKEGRIFCIDGLWETKDRYDNSQQ